MIGFLTLVGWKYPLRDLSVAVEGHTRFMTRLYSRGSVLNIIKVTLGALLWLALVLPVKADIIYTIEDGDSAWSVAIRFGVSLEALYAANGWASDENPVLQIGQEIAIPTDREPSESSSSDDNTESQSGETTYIVQSGDTFSTIAEQYDVSTLALTQYNDLAVDDVIRPGQLLSIPPSDFEAENAGTSEETETSPPPAPEPLHYRVQSGDSPWGIARQFGISLQTLLSYNDLADDAVLQIGDELLVPVEAGGLTARSNSSQRHTVAAGDTLGGIASGYGTSAEAIAVANNITTTTMLRIGQELIIPVYRTTPTPESTTESTPAPAAEPVPIADLSTELTPLPDINDIPSEGSSAADIAGWHSELFDFTQIEDPVPSSEDPAPVSEGGFSIDGYFSDGVPYHLYTIRRGDTLGDVAHEFGITQSELLEANALDTRSTLRIGRDLKIPLPKPETPNVGGGSSGSSGSITWGAPDSPIGNYEGTPTGLAVVEEASKYLGTPYVYGGNSLTGGIDCSGFTSAIYRMFGIELHRSAADQVLDGREVSYSELQPGDIVLFHTTRPGISHAGLYIGNGDFIHSSSYRGGVVISPLDEGYYNERFVCARRVLD